jgi:uncharacterized membrane protein
MIKFLKSQLTFLLFGFVFWLPIVILLSIIAFTLNNLEEAGRKILLVFIPQKLFYSGFGITFTILIIYLSGIILKLTAIKNVLSKIPVLGLFFGKGEIMTVDRLLHLMPCLFLYSPTSPSYGWIVSEEMAEINGETLVMLDVYYPNVPTLITGQIFVVRKETVIKLGNPSKEIIDLLWYSLKSPKSIKYLPWEGETQENFEKRAKNFGLILSTD